MYSTSQAARYLNVCPCTLRRWESRGKLIPHRTMGNHRRYTKEQLDQIYGIYDTEPDSPSSDRSSVLRFPVGYARVSSSLQENLYSISNYYQLFHALQWMLKTEQEKM